MAADGESIRKLHAFYSRKARFFNQRERLLVCQFIIKKVIYN